MILSSINWDVSPIMFRLGGIEVRWYGIMFAVCFIVSYLLLKQLFKKDKIDTKYLDKLAVYIFVGVLLGARLGHCLFYEFDYYSHHIIEMLLPIKITHSGWHFIGYQGLASHGGAIGILISVALFSYKNKISFMWILDRLAIAICFAGASIRLGNLFNSEIYGCATSLPWGFIFVRDGQNIACHPTQLYESLSYVIIGILLFCLLKSQKIKFNQGFLFGVFLILLFGVRFLIEFVKNNQETWEDNMFINMGQILSIPFILLGIILLIISLHKNIGKPIDISKLKQK